MYQLPSARDDRTLHYVNLSRYTREGKPAEWMLGKFWQIDESLYDEFLSMLPPRYCTGGFRMSERLTGEIAATFVQVGGQYWCGFTDLTTLKPEKLVSHISKLVSKRNTE